jgi:hypothetical protein
VDPLFRMVLVAPPAVQGGSDHPHQAGAVDLEIATEGLEKKTTLLSIADMFMPPPA